MRVLALMVGLLALAACGADGEPETPDARSSGPGVSVTVAGTAEIGVSG